MKLLIASLFLMMALVDACKRSEICSCKEPKFITAPPVTQVSDIGDVVLEFINENYKQAPDPFIIGLQLNYKGAESSDFQIDQENKCFWTELKGGVFEVEGEEFEVDIEMTGQGTDIGPVNKVWKCKQRNGEDKLDFCNVFLRERIFEKLVGLACTLADNKPKYCCN